jgi:hypothetical protein
MQLRRCFLLLPASCGERVGVRGWGALPQAQTRGKAPSPGTRAKSAHSDLSPPGRGEECRERRIMTQLHCYVRLSTFLSERQVALHLSPTGRGRREAAGEGTLHSRIQRVGDHFQHAVEILVYVDICDPHMRKPSDSNIRVRSASRTTAAGETCVTPSTSTISFPSIVTKSTTNRSIGCCRRNFQCASRRFLSACHKRASASA